MSAWQCSILPSTTCFIIALHFFRSGSLHWLRQQLGFTREQFEETQAQVSGASSPVGLLCIGRSRSPFLSSQAVFDFSWHWESALLVSNRGPHLFHFSVAGHDSRILQLVFFLRESISELNSSIPIVSYVIMFHVTGATRSGKRFSSGRVILCCEWSVIISFKLQDPLDQAC